MEEIDSKQFILELLQKIERHLIQQSSMTHVISSLKEMDALKAFENVWCEKLLYNQFEEADFETFQQYGHRLHDTYQLNLYDVIELIDIAQNFCVTSLPETYSNLSTEGLFENIEQTKQALAHGYFLSSIETFVERFANGNFSENKAMQLHKQWLMKLKRYYDDASNDPPIMEHSLCAFSNWLETLEAKMILHACVTQDFDMQANILLAHRTVHEEASHIAIYLNQKAYLKALNHFQNLRQAFLLLDKYINEAHFTYLNNAFYNFIDFVMTESRHQKNLHYYFVIHYGLIDQAEFDGAQKQELLEKYALSFIKVCEDAGLDFIYLKEKQRIHLVIQAHSGRQNLSQQHLVESALQEIEKHYSKAFSQQLYINSFDLIDIPSYEPEIFSALLYKIQKYKHQEHVYHLSSQELSQYHYAVEQDFKLLDAIQLHLKEQSLEIHYQPIVESNGKIQTVEVLLRLPIEKHVLDAADFLGVVEQNHLTTDIDLFVFNHLRKELHRLKPVTTRLNVNVYPKSLSKPEIISALALLAREAKNNEIELMIEITEHDVLVHDEVLIRLHQDHGLLFAIDDFGTGYSNLSNLVEFASRNLVHLAKLDGALIEDIASDKTKFDVVRFVVEMARNLDLQPVILEYVDSEQKLQLLQQLPAELLYQGHYFNKALPLETLLEEYS